MKRTVRLEKLVGQLPTETQDALARLRSEGFFDDVEECVKRRAVVTESEQFIDGEYAVRQYISTRDVDRDADVMVPKGAVLDQFLLAPQVLWGHDYSTPPIGRAESVVADNYGLRAKTVFAVEQSRLAAEVWSLIQGGFLATASVGFIPLEVLWQGDPKWRDTVDRLNRSWDTDIERAGADRIITKWLLLEYSIVPVPANINALVTAVAKGGMELSEDMKSALGLGEAKQPEPESRPTPEPTPEPRRVVLPLEQPRGPRIVEVLSAPSEPRRIAIEVLDQLRGRA